MGFGRPDCNVCNGSGFIRPRGGAQYECRSCIGVTDSEWRERQERSARAQATRQEPGQSRPMAASLTEEELARLDRVVATWADLGTDGVSLPWRELEAVLVALPALLASARAMRNVSDFCRGVIAGAAENAGVEHVSNTVETLTDLANEVLLVINEALTATAEPTACISCNGRGIWGGDMTCPRCGGTGTAEPTDGEER